MHRAFVSLYILIVASVVLVGLGFDALLGLYEPENSANASDRDLFVVLDERVAVGYQDPPPLAASRFATYQMSDFANTKMAERLRSGELVVVHSKAGVRQLFKLATDSSLVLSVTQKVPEHASSNLYNLLVVVFYVLIAGVVFLWVWPLSRDLRKLESSTRLIGQDHLLTPLGISHTSPVYDLAASFNRMSERVKGLLASHKEMTYAVSHELRTPLARMKFALAMAQNTDDEAKLQSQLNSVKEDVAEMDSLVNELLTYAGFEHSTQPLLQQAGDMNYLIEQLIQRVKSSVPASQIEFEFSPTVADKCQVTCEWHLMERAIQNLLQNAERFASTKVRVHLKVDDTRFEIFVEDDGPGVAEEDRERIFQTFVRLSNHTNAKARGFGLGLAIVRRVAQWHLGGAEVTRSASLGGAKFRLWWPSLN